MRERTCNHAHARTYACMHTSVCFVFSLTSSLKDEKMKKNTNKIHPAQLNPAQPSPAQCTVEPCNNVNIYSELFHLNSNVYTLFICVPMAVFFLLLRIKFTLSHFPSSIIFFESNQINLRFLSPLSPRSPTFSFTPIHSSIFSFLCVCVCN